MSNFPGTEEHMVVVSSDCHIGPPLDQLREYCPQKHLDEFDEFAAKISAIDGEARSGAPGFDDGFMQRMAQLSGLGHYDSAERLRELDEDGVAAEVIFHGSQNGMPIPFMIMAKNYASGEQGTSNANGLLPLPDPEFRELASVGIRMYNRWLADYCSAAPHRRAGVAHIPIWDIEASAAEVKWAHDAGLKAVNFPAYRDSLPPYNYGEWDPLWAACEAAGMPLNNHVGSADVLGSTYSGPGGALIFAHEIRWFCQRAMWFMILGGVFDRFPHLNLVFTENPGNWLSPAMAELDALQNFFGGNLPYMTEDQRLKRKPSEVIASNLYIGASFMSRPEVEACIADGLTDRFMWGSDWPHAEGTYPISELALRSAFAGTPLEHTRKIVGLNAVEVFNLDLDKLRDVAQKIGPTAETINRPLVDDELPKGSEWCLAFRTQGAWG
jgi:predicted TIM-barrel fold metal-dependent hydrolase